MCTVGPPIKNREGAPLDELQPYPLYLDHNATTPMSEAAWRAMVDLHEAWGNPSSVHGFGLEGKYYLDAARKRCATALGTSDPTEIVFCSGGTEANNIAIIGAWKALNSDSGPKGKRVVISSSFEHPATEMALKQLELLGAIVERIPIQHATGVIDVSSFESSLRKWKDQVAVVTVMHANNELGTIQPISVLTKIFRQIVPLPSVFHTDAAQSIGKVPVDVRELGVDLLSICSHKFYGPKGIGALYRRSGVLLCPVAFGAGQESGIRPGTENVLLISSMSVALLEAQQNFERHVRHSAACRDSLFSELQRHCAANGLDIVSSVSTAEILPNTLNIALRHKATGKFISSKRLIWDCATLVAMSAGAACHSAHPGDGDKIEVSSSLKAIGIREDHAAGVLRLTTGRLTKIEDMPRAAKIIARRAAQQFDVS